MGSGHDGDEGALGDAADGLGLGPGDDGEDDGEGEEIEEDEAEETMDHDHALPIRSSSELLLKGVKIVIIHMKEKLIDGPAIGEIILKQLKDYEAEARLGCEFVIAKVGEAMYF